jgi:hypothetical protein
LQEQVVSCLADLVAWAPEGMDVDQQDAFGRNCLHQAASILRPSLPSAAKLLREIGRRSKGGHRMKDQQGHTPFNIFMLNSVEQPYAVEIMRLWQELGWDLNAEPFHGDMDLLNQLVADRRHRAISLLLQYDMLGLEWDVRAPDGLTFVERGMHMQPKDSPGSTARLQQLTSCQLNTISVYCQMWQQRAKEKMTAAVSEHLIPQLTDLVQQYMDGSGKPWQTEEEDESEEEREFAGSAPPSKKRKRGDATATTIGDVAPWVAGPPGDTPPSPRTPTQMYSLD